MKKVQKGWLADNTVTTDNKTDKILLLESAGSADLDGILEEMLKQDTGLCPETLRHSIALNNPSSLTLLLPPDLAEARRIVPANSDTSPCRAE